MTNNKNTSTQFRLAFFGHFFLVSLVSPLFKHIWIPMFPYHSSIIYWTLTLTLWPFGPTNWYVAKQTKNRFWVCIFCTFWGWIICTLTDFLTELPNYIHDSIPKHTYHFLNLKTMLLMMTKLPFIKTFIKIMQNQSA